MSFCINWQFPETTTHEPETEFLKHLSIFASCKIYDPNPNISKVEL